MIAGILSLYVSIGAAAGMLYWLAVADMKLKPPKWKLLLATAISGPVLWAILAVVLLLYVILLLYTWLSE